MTRGELNAKVRRCVVDAGRTHRYDETAAEIIAAVLDAIKEPSGEMLNTPATIPYTIWSAMHAKLCKELLP